ncbi:MAG: hypothetical protein AAFV71_27875 [Cyanobacteria bacterium J06633_8]
MAFRLKNQKATVSQKAAPWVVKSEEELQPLKSNDWVIVDSPKHKLDKQLCQVGTIRNDEYWVTYFGKRHTDQKQIACFSKAELTRCTNKTKITAIIQRYWGDASKDNSNRCLKPEIAAEFTQPKPKRRKTEKTPEIEGVLESVDD